MNKPYIEFKKYTAEDMINGVPEMFDNEIDRYAKLALLDPYGFIFPYGDTTQKPIFYMRHANTDMYRWGTFMSPGDGYLSLQTGAHAEEVAQKGTPMTMPYQKLSDNPVIYGMGTEKPFSEIRLYENYSTWKEGDFFDVKAVPLPFAIFDHADIFPRLSQVMQPCIISGFYEGKPVLGMGNYDRIYIPKEDKRDVGESLAYILAYGHGYREDGRLETYLACLHEDGSSCGIYWIEGEEPIYVNDVFMETEWVHLPYVKDGTVTYKDATFKIGSKVIHFTGKWGSKGLTPYPRYERNGQSEIFGTWYEGNIPYKHKLFFTLNENMDTYDHTIRKLGFKVID